MKAKNKDLLREIKNSLNRYLSILAIMALGVAFYAGIRSAEPDMQETAKQFYDDNNYMDIWVAGAMGLTDRDVEKVSDLSDKFTVEGMYSTEMFMEGKTKNYQLSVYSIGKEVNKVHIIEGRIPEKEDEVFVDSFFMDSVGDLKIGDTITLFAEEDAYYGMILSRKEFTVVGYGTYPQYLSWERGTVGIGNGSADAFIFLHPDAFVSGRYSYMNITVDGAKDYNPFSDAYDDYIEKYTDMIEALDEPFWYVLDRNSVQSFVEYGMDAERIGKIGLVFPAVFFIVATLVSLTTMTRMVEEQRTQVGTYKALGYSKLSTAAKFFWYSLSASLIGGVAGAYAGSKLLPLVIIDAYKILYYHLPKPVLNIQFGLAGLSIAIAVGCTVLATLVAGLAELRAEPSVLMRPAAPAAGRRILLEHIKPLWKHMSFSWKATCRNLFRYKKRLFMTIFGIGGCMGLLLVGFGLRDSIGSIVDNQYLNIWSYDATANISKSIDLSEYSDISDSLLIRNESINVAAGENIKEIQLFVPESLDNLESFLKLQDRVTDEKYTLTTKGVVICEKLARIYDLKVGDRIYLCDGDIPEHEVEITAISENYLYYYVYMSKDQYMELYGEEPVYNQILIKYRNGLSEAGEKELLSDILAKREVTSVKSITSLQATVNNMMKSLDYVIIVLIVSAGLLAFIVLYNLNNINIIERRRELATIRVLGFYDTELAMYVYRENICLTVLGIGLGCVIGFFLHKFVIETCEIDMIMFGRDISTASYIYSVLLTILFAIIVNAGMFRRLRKIDMVESLKSAE